MYQRPRNYSVDTNASLGADYTSRTIPINDVNGYSLQAVFTGSPVGVMSLECSNDATNWSTIDGTSISITGADNIVYNVVDPKYGYVRVFYDRTSGSGTLTDLRFNNNGF